MIPRATIERLALYYRTLRLMQHEGIQVTSSNDLAKRLGITPVQLRKDLAFFGQFGMKGIGYFTNELIYYIERILGLQNQWRIAIIGVGHLGSALANYQNFPDLGFKIEALFDNDEQVIGTKIHDMEVSSIKNLKLIVKKRDIHIGVITVPAKEAQGVVNLLATTDIKGIWNFAPVQLDVPSHIRIVNQDLSINLSTLSYLISN